MVWPLIAVLGSYIDKSKKQQEAKKQAYGDVLAQYSQDLGGPQYEVQAARAQNQISQMQGIEAGQLAKALSDMAQEKDDEDKDDDDPQENPVSTVSNYRARSWRTGG